MEFKIMKNASVDDMKYVLSLIRTGKLQASTVIRMLDPYEASKSEDENVSRYSVEIWRREGGIDMFHNPSNDIFDRISVKKVIEMSGTTYFAKSAPIGALLENNLTESVKCDIFLSEQIVTENVFVKIMAGICRNYGYNFDELQLRENRYIVPETIIEF